MDSVTLVSSYDIWQRNVVRMLPVAFQLHDFYVVCTATDRYALIFNQRTVVNDGPSVEKLGKLAEIMSRYLGHLFWTNTDEFIAQMIEKAETLNSPPVDVRLIARVRQLDTLTGEDFDVYLDDMIDEYAAFGKSSLTPLERSL